MCTMILQLDIGLENFRKRGSYSVLVSLFYWSQTAIKPRMRREWPFSASKLQGKNSSFWTSKPPFRPRSLSEKERVSKRERGIAKRWKKEEEEEKVVSGGAEEHPRPELVSFPFLLLHFFRWVV